MRCFKFYLLMLLGKKMALGTTGRLGALLFAAALGAGIAVRRKQDRFVYSDQGIEDEDILQALEFVNARKTQKGARA